jgi:hypothetical protein
VPVVAFLPDGDIIPRPPPLEPVAIPLLGSGHHHFGNSVR